MHYCEALDASQWLISEVVNLGAKMIHHNHILRCVPHHASLVVILQSSIICEQEIIQYDVCLVDFGCDTEPQKIIIDSFQNLQTSVVRRLRKQTCETERVYSQSVHESSKQIRVQSIRSIKPFNPSTRQLDFLQDKLSQIKLEHQQPMIVNNANHNSEHVEDQYDYKQDRIDKLDVIARQREFEVRQQKELAMSQTKMTKFVRNNRGRGYTYDYNGELVVVNLSQKILPTLSLHVTSRFVEVSNENTIEPIQAEKAAPPKKPSIQPQQEYQKQQIQSTKVKFVNGFDNLPQDQQIQALQNQVLLRMTKKQFDRVQQYNQWRGPACVQVVEPPSSIATIKYDEPQSVEILSILKSVQPNDVVIHSPIKSQKVNIKDGQIIHKIDSDIKSLIQELDSANTNHLSLMCIKSHTKRRKEVPTLNPIVNESFQPCVRAEPPILPVRTRSSARLHTLMQSSRQSRQRVGELQLSHSLVRQRSLSQKK